MIPMTSNALKNNGMEILVFKTNLYNARCISDVETALNFHPLIFRWNVDLNDSDNILRVVSSSLTGTEVEHLLLQEGYYCEELAD